MDKFGFPTNIKQIGNIDENIRVYIEDSVYSYLMKLSESREQEYIAALIGRCMIIDGKTVLFINGTVQGLYAEMEKGILKFSTLSIEHIEEEREKYFKGLEVVGWLLSQPNYGNFLSTGYINYHKQHFTKPYQVLFVTDPIEKIHTFFNWSYTQDDVVESEGFFIYYDRNSDMQAYAEVNKIIHFQDIDNISLKLLDDDIDTNSNFDNLENFNDLDDLNSDILYNNDLIDLNNESAESSTHPKTKPLKLTTKETQRVIQTLNKLSNEKTPQRKKQNSKSSMSEISKEKFKHTFKDNLKDNFKEPLSQNQKVMNLLFMVSSLMFVISVLLGFGVMKSDNKIAELEEKVVLVTKAYDELIDEFMGDVSTPVFNNTNNPIDVNAAETTSINDVLDGLDSDDIQLVEQINLEENDSENLKQENLEEENPEQNTEQIDLEEPKLKNSDTKTNDSSSAELSTVPETYQIDAGDTLTSISKRFYGSDDMQVEIMKLNGIDDPNKIYYGMVIELP